MANEFYHFKILFSLFDKFYEGKRGWQDLQAILGEEDLRYIARETIIADIYFLQGENLLQTRRLGLDLEYTRDNMGFTPTHVQITGGGIKVINFILDNYPLFLQKRSDKDSKDQASHILAITHPRGKRLQTYEYIKHQLTVFKNFLHSTNAFSKSRKVIDVTNNDSDNLITNIINSLFNLNQLGLNKFGFPIFKSNSKLLNDLRQDGNDQNWLALQLTRIATLIDEIYYDEIKKQVTNPPKGSINLLEALFRLRQNSFDKTAFQGLRTLHKLRSTITPIHGGEHEAIQILENMGILYPVSNWSEAGKKCLEEFLSCINKLVSCLN
jgi:hypothetical protein